MCCDCCLVYVELKHLFRNCYWNLCFIFKRLELVNMQLVFSIISRKFLNSNCSLQKTIKDNTLCLLYLFVIMYYSITQ